MTTGSDAAKPTDTINSNLNLENRCNKDKAKATSKPANANAVTTGFCVQSTGLDVDVVFWDGSTKDGPIGPTYISTTSATTRADGTFDDAPEGACRNVPFTTALTTSQDIKILTTSGLTYTVRHNDFKFTSTNLTNHGTATNGSDIQATQ